MTRHLYSVFLFIALLLVYFLDERRCKHRVPERRELPYVLVVRRLQHVLQQRGGHVLPTHGAAQIVLAVGRRRLDG